MAGHPLLAVSTPPTAASPSRQAIRTRRVPLRARCDFTRSLAVTVGARLTILQALDLAVEEGQHPRLQPMVQAVRDRVRRGESLSDSLAAFPAAFDAYYIQLTKLGETTGRLSEVLHQLAEHLEKTAALKRKIQLALFYPALILFVAFGAILFMLTTIVPTFAEIFADFGTTLPGPTQFVLDLSHGLTAFFPMLLVGGALCFGAGHLIFRLPAVTRWTDRVAFRLPLLGGLLQRGFTARFCRALGLMLQSGVPLDKALSILVNTTKNSYLVDQMNRVLQRLRKGKSFHTELKGISLFPAMMLQMMAVGEETAELPTLLTYLATHYEQEVDTFTGLVTSLLEPLLILFLGVVMTALLVAMYLPIFDLTTVLG